MSKTEPRRAPPSPNPDGQPLTKPVGERPKLDAKANQELLFKGSLCAVIGLAVLLLPYFMGASEMRNVIAGASSVGWFSLVLGAALAGKALARQWKAKSL